MSNLKYNFKICILGNTKTGKSCYLNSLTKKQYLTEIEPTIGVDFQCYILNYNNDDYKFQCYDMSGLPSFYKIVNNYYEITNIFFIFIDPINFKEDYLLFWYNGITKHKQSLDNIKILVIVNKCDLFSDPTYKEKFYNKHKKIFKNLKLEVFFISSKNFVSLEEPLIYIINHYNKLIKNGLIDLKSIKIYNNSKENDINEPLLQYEEIDLTDKTKDETKCKYCCIL
jgi:small GTP-binding protein